MKNILRALSLLVVCALSACATDNADDLVPVGTFTPVRSRYALPGAATTAPASTPAPAQPTFEPSPLPEPLASLVGDDLFDSEGNPAAPSVLDGQIVGLYFSASWCPPCRAFSPVLVKFAEKLRAEGKPFTLVLVGSDDTREAALKYMNSHNMPGYLIPPKTDAKKRLARLFDVEYIPKLVIVDSTRLLDPNARATVQKANAPGDAWDQWTRAPSEAAEAPTAEADAAPEAAAPAAPASTEPSAALVELFGKDLLTDKGKKADLAELTGKTIALYFSASWCPPCRAFTPRLVDLAEKLQSEGKPFAIVLVGCDQTKKKALAYMKDHKMSGYLVPPDTDANEALCKRYHVSGIPYLAILAPDGTTVDPSGRATVQSSPDTAWDKWSR